MRNLKILLILFYNWGIRKNRKSWIPSVPHPPAAQQNSSTQFHTQFHPPQTKNSWGVCWSEGFLVWNWGMCRTEGDGTEGFLLLNWGVLVWNWRGGGTDRFLMLNWEILVLIWGVFAVELRDFGCWKGVVLVWNRRVELSGTLKIDF